MTRSSTIEEGYDQLPYPGVPVLKTHPVTLATLARVFGLSPAPVSRCRVLELGCADAENLLPMAHGLPSSDFIGVDLSSVQLDLGRRMAEQLKLGNLKLLHCDLTRLDLNSLGSFDYIICHGVFSWVSDEVRAAILRLFQACLNPGGVGFLSYNSFPGWHLLEMLRGMLQRHCSPNLSPREQMREARALFALLEHSSTVAPNDVEAALKPELLRLKQRSDAHVFHEYLTEHNKAFYFEELAAMLKLNGLQHLANAVPETMTPANYGPEVARYVAESHEETEGQQRLDMMLGRGFNSALICRADEPVNRTLDPDVIAEMWFDASVSPDPANSPEVAVTVLSSSGISALIEDKDLKVALSLLNKAQPRGLQFEALFEGVIAQTPSDRPHEDRRLRLLGSLVRLFFGAVVGMATWHPPMVSRPGEHPLASGLARLQAKEGGPVASQWHQPVTLEAEALALLAVLDGQSSVADLIEQFGEEVPAQLLRFAMGGVLLA